MITQKMIDEMTDNEFWQIIKPHVFRCNAFLKNTIIPEYIAFELADAFRNNLLIEEDFKQTFYEVTEPFNCSLDEKSTMKLVNKILKEKYSLKIISTNPMLKIKEI